jgi:hypothetical protein
MQTNSSNPPSVEVIKGRVVNISIPKEFQLILFSLSLSLFLGESWPKLDNGGIRMEACHIIPRTNEFMFY